MSNLPYQSTRPPTPEFRQCFNCYYETVTPETFCPRCSNPKFLTKESIRIRGMIGIAVGIFLVVFMLVIAVGVGLLLMGASKDPAHVSRINNGIYIIIGMYGLFALIAAFGLQAIFSGLWMAISGNHNRIIVWATWGFLALVAAAGVAVRLLLP